MMAKRRKKTELTLAAGEYDGLMGGIAEVLEQSRRTSARAVNSILTATYWEIGRRIVEFEQGGETRAEYGDALLKRLARDLVGKFGRGFSHQGLYKMRSFYLGWEIFPTPSGKLEASVIMPPELMGSGPIFPTVSGKLESTEGHIRPPAETPAIRQTLPAKSPHALDLRTMIGAFPLSWSHYVRLMSVDKPLARAFYEAEAIRGGWSVRQLDRQISTQFFERSSLSKQQAAMLARGQKPKPEDAVSVDDEIRDPYLLEFLNLKDEYSESELEDALIEHLETFLLELGAGFTFVARQKRIRIGTEWYRIDLLLFHRRLKCLVVIDLKLGKFTHADAGQMGLYLTYAKRHLTEAGENDPVGIILCSGKDDAVVEYAMGDMNARVFASKYLTQLPDEETLRKEIEATRRALLHRQSIEP
jgi:predicted nuclease of restriction endonuclease-like (RecB) superfamily